MKIRQRKFFLALVQKWFFPMEGGKYGLLLGCLFLFAFFISVICFFPVDELRGKIEGILTRGFGTDVTIERLAIVFPPALEAKNVRAALPAPAPYFLRFDSLLLKPAWNAFVMGRCGYAFSARMGQGTAEGETDDEGRFSVDFRGLRFAIPLSGKGSAVLEGILRHGIVSGRYPPATDDETVVELDIVKLEVKGTKAFGLAGDVLPLGRLRFQGEGRGASLRIERLSLSGGLIEGDSKGILVLRTPLDMSTFRLTANVRVAPEAAGVGEMLSLIQKPKPGGVYRFRLVGTLKNPILR